MSWFYRKVVRPTLFSQEAEQAHRNTLRNLAWLSRHGAACKALHALFGSPELPVELFGLRFPNPIGLAAGMDKNAEAVPAWEALGFGFSELGGVTWHPQPGNPAPRIFRAVPDEAIINRMGFNNEGAEALATKLKLWRASNRWPSHPVGINLGKSKLTPLNEAAEDYAKSFRVLREHADFFVINVSSPNTPNLRQLQDKAALDEILAAIQEANDMSHIPDSFGKPDAPVEMTGTARKGQCAKAILVKIAPDLSFEALDEILELAGPHKLAGIVATNTTITRPPTGHAATERVYAETGGLSGRPLRARSTEIIRHLFRQTNGKLPIIGVGGVFSASDAWDKITAGASLVQIYTGLVYEGPGLPSEIVKGLLTRLRMEGCSGLSAAVGTKR